MRKLLYILLFNFYYCSSFCQDINGEVKKEFFQISFPFVNEKPAILKLDKQTIIDYCYDWYADKRQIKPIDSLTLFEMIDNQKNDTTHWNENEIYNCYLVKTLPISIDNVRNKLTLKNDTTLTQLVELINNSKNCGYSDFSKAVVYSISRPIFDKSKTFALIEYDLLNCYNEGHGEIRLFKIFEGTWKKIDTIHNWRTIVVF